MHGGSRACMQLGEENKPAGLGSCWAAALVSIGLALGLGSGLNWGWIWANKNGPWA